MDNLLNLTIDAILEIEMKLARDSDGKLSFINFKIDNIEEKYLKDIIKAIYLMTKESQFLNMEDSFLIIVRDKLAVAKMTKNRLATLIRNKFEINNIKGKFHFAINDLKANDDLYIVKGKLDMFLQKSIAQDEDIIEDYNSEKFKKKQKEIINIFRLIFRKKEMIKVSNFYKGIIMTHEVSVDNVLDTMSIDVTINKAHSAVIYIDKNTVIEHKLLGVGIKAHLVGVRWSEKEATIRFNNFQILKESPIQRQNIRVEPKGDLFVDIEFLNRAMRGRLLNLSINGIAMQFTNFLDKELVNEMEVKLIFNLPKVKVKIDAKVIVTNQKEKKVILSISPTKISQRQILNYIASREIELIKELRSNMSDYIRYEQY